MFLIIVTHVFLASTEWIYVEIFVVNLEFRCEKLVSLNLIRGKSVKVWNDVIQQAFVAESKIDH